MVFRKMPLYFSLRQVPEWSCLSEDDLLKVARRVMPKVLREFQTLLGFLAIAIVMTPFAYLSIVIVRSEPLRTILAVITGVCFGVAMYQWLIHQTRASYRAQPTLSGEEKGEPGVGADSR